jgi:hypothetical protein
MTAETTNRVILRPGTELPMNRHAPGVSPEAVRHRVPTGFIEILHKVEACEPGEKDKIVVTLHFERVAKKTQRRNIDHARGRVGQVRELHDQTLHNDVEGHCRHRQINPDDSSRRECQEPAADP